MRRSFKFLLRPTGAHATVRYGDRSGELKHIRREAPDGQGRWPKDGDGCRWDFQPEHPAASAGRLAAAQRDIARTKRGSRRRGKAVARVAALPAKARRQRLDTARKAAPRLIGGYDVIVCEALNIAGMTRRAAPKPEGEGGWPPSGRSAKSGLNKSILDAGWGVFLRILAYKAECAGRELIAVNPADTSRTCSRCGHCAKENRVTQAGSRWTACGHTAHADANAAKNILRAGLALREAARAAWREAAPFRERRSHTNDTRSPAPLCDPP
ncbi:RNA-guided endonuclease InsQ/TnpB family protein [Spongiactinospora sp. 9N601]|uniref:RNA-guided endonuclease InsQ/TnpB family protein n=1 Tax=Spongiactinospora sp. 9N601 TaxID=3375149 RepID=UPI0037BD0554